MWTVEEIRKNYRKFEDWKIIELASNPRGVRKDIVPVLNEEIERRNLDVELIKWVNYETNTFEGLERKNLILKIRKSECSICADNSGLNGYQFTTIISALLIITNKTELKIICDDCARDKRLKSMSATFFFGWWSKRGLVATPFHLISDLIRIFRKEAEDKEIIDEFIYHNTGKLRIALENGDDLNEIIASFNSLIKGD